MTQNQLQYQANLETQRANRAREYENFRTNMANEGIKRMDSNTRRMELRETQRKNNLNSLLGFGELPAKYISAAGSAMRGAGSMISSIL